MGAGIPLPALHVEAPQQPDTLGNFQKLLAIKQQQAMAPLQQQEAKQNIQASGLQLQQQQQQMKDQESFRTAMADPSMQGKTIGQVADALAQKGQISQASWSQAKKADTEHQQALATKTKTDLENMKSEHDETQNLYNNVMSLPDDQLQAQWPAIAQQYNSIPGNEKMPMDPNKPLSKQQLSQFAPVISMGNTYFDQELARRTKETDSQKSKVQLMAEEAKQRFYQNTGVVPGVPAEDQQMADWLKKNPGKGPSDYQIAMKKVAPMTTFTLQSNLLSDQAKQMAADNYKQTGQLPAGMRSPAMSAGVLNEAAKGGPVSVAANRATYHADADSLRAMQKQFDNVTAFENTAGKNLDTFLKTAKEVVDSGSPLLNKPLRSLSDAMMGSPNMAAYKAARQTAITEIAKVLSSANAGSGVLSDSARHEVEGMIGPDATLKQIYSAANILKQDMKNRHDAYSEQLGTIKQRMGQQNNGAQQGDGESSDPFAAFGGKKH